MKKIILILLFLILISFKTGDNKSNYTVPRAAYSVTAGDIDMDGDNDIVVGHNYSSQTQWSGVSIMLNDGNGYFYLFDSVFLYAGQSDVLIKNLNTTSNKEIIAKYIDAQIENEYIAIINDFSLPDISYFSLNTNEGIDKKTTGDINGDANIDIVVASNGGKFWGVLYNDGYGNLTEPEYHYVTDYFPTALSCGDLNGDDREDIVICGQSTEVYFSYPDSFQLLLLETNDFKQDVSVVDFDLDGDLDIVTFADMYLANYTRLKIYKNIGNNNFDTIDNFDFQPSCSIMFVSDFNNDSLPDVIFHTSTGAFIFYNQDDFQLSGPQFVEIPDVGEYERYSYCADMDGNGYNDIITLRYLYMHLNNNLSILFNDGNGNFVDDPVTAIEKLQSHNKISLKCYPNPFINEIDFECSTEKNARVMLAIYDISGKLIKGLTSDEINIGQYGKLMKTHKITWDGTGNNGQYCKPGLYIAALEINGALQQTIKVLKY